MAVPSTLQAQDLSRSTPALNPPDREYAPRGLTIGSFQLDPSADVRLEYDDNVYAVRDGTEDDGVLSVTPRLIGRYAAGKLELRGSAEARFRRYFDLKDENSTGAHIATDALWRLSTGQAVRATARWTRAVEDRGDPEARDPEEIGPRLTNVYGAELRYQREEGVLGLDMEGVVEKFDPVSAIDAERKHTSYSGLARFEYRLSGSTFASLAGFISRRDFDTLAPVTMIDRSATTYGANAGVRFDSGGLIEGRAAAGVFRFNSDDPTIRSRTGLSISAGLVYRPTQRTAVLLDAFRGDVATFRRGAQARTDTRLRLALQQEIRHNLRAQINGFYRRSKFIGSGIAEDTIGTYGELEYLFSRNIAVALTARYAKRSSDDPLDEFERFRGGIEFRLAY